MIQAILETVAYVALPCFLAVYFVSKRSTWNTRQGASPLVRTPETEA